MKTKLLLSTPLLLQVSRNKLIVDHALPKTKQRLLPEIGQSRQEESFDRIAGQHFFNHSLNLFVFVNGLVHEFAVLLLDRSEKLKELLGTLEKSIFETDVIEKLVAIGNEDD